MSDADFRGPTKDIIAGRAGFRCSYPGCNRVTIGPCDDPEECDPTGMACHIYSSAENGPRGTGGLSVDERRMACNGIWCCYTHGKLIDNKDGIDYPASLLQQWKCAHEARINHEHRGIPVPFGWLSRLEVPSSPLFVPDTKIELGKVNLLVGPNGTGKTALCEIITAAGGDLQQIGRWKTTEAGGKDWDVRLNYACPDPHVFRGTIGGGNFRFSIDDTVAADINHGLRFVYLKDGLFAYDPIDDVARISDRCGVERDRVTQAISHVADLNLPFLKSISIADFDPNADDGMSEEETARLKHELRRLGLRSPQQIRASIGDHKGEFALGQLSHRETSIATISIAIAIADLMSRHAPTVMIIDLGDQVLPNELLDVYTNELARDRFRFQTILVSPYDRPTVNWTGWSVISFNKKPPGVVITQSDIRGPTLR